MGMCCVNVFVCFLFLCFTPLALCLDDQVQYEKLCVDPECSVPISYATALVSYMREAENGINFKVGDILDVISKPLPKDSAWARWEVKRYDSKRKKILGHGFAPKDLLKEFKILVKKRNLLAVLTPEGKNLKENHVQVVNVENAVVKTTPIEPVAGGVAAEAGNGGPPATPFLGEIDGTSIFIDTNGETSILATTTQRPSYQTQTPSPAPETHPKLSDPPPSPATNDAPLTDVEPATNSTDSEEEENDKNTDEEEEEEEVEEDEGEDEEEGEEASVETVTEPEVLNTSHLSNISNEEASPPPVANVENTVLNDLRTKTKESDKEPTETFQNPPENVDKAQKSMETEPSPHETRPSSLIANDNSILDSEFGKSAPPLALAISQAAVGQNTLPNQAITDFTKPAAGDNEKHPENSAIVHEQELKDKNTDDLATVSEEDPSSVTPAPNESHTNSESLPASAPVTPPEETLPTPTSTTTEKPVQPDMVSPSSTTEAYKESSYEPEVEVTTSNSVLDDAIPTKDPISSVNVPDQTPPPSPDISEELLKSFIYPPPSERNQLPEATLPLLQHPTHAPIYPGLFPKVEPVKREEPPVVENLLVNDTAPITDEEVKTESSGYKKLDEGVGSVEELKLDLPTPQQDSNEESEPSSADQSSGMLNGFTGLFSGLFGSDETVNTENEPVNNDFLQASDDSPNLAPPQPIPLIDAAVPDGECKTVRGLESDCVDAPSPPHLLEFFEKTVPGTSYTFLYLVITAISVLIFTLGHFFIERTRQEGLLIAKVNKLTHELQVATSQVENKGVQESFSLAETNNEALLAVQAELSDLKRTKIELESQLESVQQELDAATEAGLELNRMLSDLLTQRHGSDSLLKSVEQLQGQLNVQQRVIDEMNRSLIEKSDENEVLRNELSAAQGKVDSLDEELSDMRQNLNLHLKEKESMTWDLENRNTKLEADLATLEETKATEVAALSQSISELKKKLVVRESEFRALSETIEELKNKDNVDSKALFDVGHVKAKLSRVLIEKEELKETLSEEEGARKLLEAHVKNVDEEVTSLRSSFETAEKEKLEAETRLAVLSNYFKEKETQLQKELGLQEAMWVQKQGDESTVFERIKSLQEEVESYNFDSFANSNEGISTNSFSSMCTDPTSSSSYIHVSLSPKKCESLWSLPNEQNPDKAESLPATPMPKPRLLSKRKSSLDFEARLERLQHMMAPEAKPIQRPIPEDLLKLQELQTVRASPFFETCSISDPPFEQPAVSDVNGKIVKCSDLVDKFETFQKPEKIYHALPNLNGEANGKDRTPAELPDFREKLKMFEINSNKNLNPLEVDSVDTKDGKRVPYCPGGKINGASPLEDIDEMVPSEPIFYPPVVLFNKSESEDSQSISRDCELASSAIMEFDIKVVANTSANVTKFKRKNHRERNGSQNDMLKKEILDQERGLKGQIATLEKKAHENWVAARHAERRLEESKQEAGQLRNMLTLMEKSGVDNDAKPVPLHPGELNGEDCLPDGTSPLPLPPLPLDPLAGPPPLLPPGFLPPPFMPPPGGFIHPPGGFIPPPPFLPGDRRPPPLGRMSSPPLNRFSPPSGDYGYDRMSPPPLSPPVRNYRSPATRRSPPSPWDEPPPRSGFRPVASQRDPRREFPGSNLSSGHSSSESLDKPSGSRRSGGKV